MAVVKTSCMGGASPMAGVAAPCRACGRISDEKRLRFAPRLGNPGGLAESPVDRISRREAVANTTHGRRRSVHYRNRCFPGLRRSGQIILTPEDAVFPQILAPDGSLRVGAPCCVGIPKVG